VRKHSYREDSIPEGRKRKNMYATTFFYIIPHLLVHLLEEVELVGPIQSRWLYFIERYMKILKLTIRQKNHPKGSILA
jgi:hypothetical protein